MAADAKSSSKKKKAANGAAKAPSFTKDEDLHAYREMLLIRRFEEKAGQLYGMGHIGGFC
ncbi:MAG: pyruvate dehydrogenase (acetyl-transferring) E1 component subunit alpha, partial [Hyphomicrobiaceae bacterium]